jgi:death-on-curing protein
MFVITYDDLVYIHDQIIQQSGGLAGVRDESVIRSALARPHQTAFGQEIHDDLFLKAASVLDALANNHGFLDGNKRTAMAATALYLFIHDIMLSITNQEYEEFMLQVVNDKPELVEIKSWLSQHSEMIEFE